MVGVVWIVWVVGIDCGVMIVGVVGIDCKVRIVGVVEIVWIVEIVRVVGTVGGVWGNRQTELVIPNADCVMSELLGFLLLCHSSPEEAGT